MSSQAVASEKGRVEVTESVVSIPTYGPLGRDPWPNVFFKSQWYAPFYPLDRYLHPAGPRHDQTYVTVTLENEYLRVVVLPELGGHVWQMYDKVCKEHLVYNNDVVKPTRIGFRTAWCSIGIEFNFPVAHSLQSVDPLPYRIEHHEDGSASVLTWHRDRPRRIEMILRLTLRPHRRDLQVRAAMYNPSPIRRPYDYWTNAAISARPAAQYIYPTRWMQAHGGRKVYAWPMVNGDDMRFQSNYLKTVSFFAWDREPGFFGCWWSDTDNGLVHVADPERCPGKKLFNWGKRAQAWLTAVTDNSGPYAELQAGRFATQADYQWLQPGQMDVLEESWYGYHGLGGLTFAGRDVAMNATTDGGDGKPASVVRIALHSVCDIRGARIVVTADGEEVFEETVDLSASAPLHRQVNLPKPATQSVDVAVIDAHYRELLGQSISLQPAAKGRMPKAPHEKWENMFASLEDKDAAERARIGQISELNNLWPRAQEAYESALQADPNCPEALMGLAFVALRNAKFDQAAHYGRTLMGSTKSNWRRAGAYFVGVAEFSAGRADEAIAALKTAVKHPKMGQMAGLFLAMAQARSGRTKDALKTAQTLGEPVASMPVAQWLEAALAGDAFAEDPAGGWTIADEGERLDLGCERGVWAIRVGMPALGEKIIDNLLKRGAAQAREPLAWYLKGYLQHLQGNQAAAKASLAEAAALPANNKRPTHSEWTDVLQWALRTNPADRKPLGYLAPLEYWLRRADRAVEHWQGLLAANGNGDASTHYGLAMALWEARNDHKAAADILAKALAKNPNHERLYLVLDDLLVEANDVETRGQWLDRARVHCGQTDFLTERYCHWLVNQQRWSEVIDLLTEHKFGPSHGMYIRRRMWLLAHHRLALQCLAAGDYPKACDYGLAGATPPATLGEDDMAMPFASPVLLAAAEACERMGEKAKAKELLQQALRLAVAGHMHPPYTEIHRARVLLKLGRKQAAEKVLQEVLNEVLPRLEDSRAGLNKAHFHYLYALVLETRGQQDEARHHFEQADKLDLQWANLVGYSVQWGFN